MFSSNVIESVATYTDVLTDSFSPLKSDLAKSSVVTELRRAARSGYHTNTRSMPLPWLFTGWHDDSQWRAAVGLEF